MKSIIMLCHYILYFFTQRNFERVERYERRQRLCGTYDPTTGEISVNEPCTKGVCEKVDEETNEVFCKRNKTRHHDTDSDSEDEDDSSEDDTDVNVFEVPLRSLAGRWRGNRGQQQGYEGRRRQRTPVFCGTYDPTTDEITVSEPCH